MNIYPKITADTQFDTVIVANGSFPENPIALSILRNAGHIIACDGAAQTLLDNGFSPDSFTVVGDGDSLSVELKPQLNFIHIAEQEDNDLTKATRYLASLNETKPGSRVAFLAATGKREDHTLANISLLLRYYREFNLQLIMITDEGYFIPTQGDSSFTAFKGQQVSIFNFGCNRLSSDGLVWNAYPYHELWQGTLNEANTERVSLHGDGFYLVYLTFLGKH